MYLVGLHIYYKMIHGPYNVKFVYLVGLHIYYKMIHGPYNIKLIRGIFGIVLMCSYFRSKLKKSCDDIPDGY